MQDNLFEKKDDGNLEYKVLARKYRPKVFGDIISQSHVTRIIKNSIDNNKIHHAPIESQFYSFRIAKNAISA